MSLVGYYPLDVGTNSGTNIANLTTGTNIYDASLNGGAYISTSNFRLGKGALATDASGQFVKINNSLTTTNAGVTFAFWARANNLCGQYTLLDYSSGSGGKQKITLGLQNNTLYGQVVNGTGLNALTNFSASATFTTVDTTGCYGMCMTTDGQRIVYCDYNNGNVYTYLLISGTWTLKNTLSVGSSPIGVCCTADGSRLVISRRAGVLQWATWNGSGYTGLTTAGLSGNPDGGPSMTPDGRILIVSRGNTNGPNTVVYSFWTGTNYTTFNNVSSTSQKWIYSAITADGSRVAYVSYNTTQTAYVSFWNATTQSYGNETALTTLNGPPTNICFSKDGNIIIVGIQNATASTGYQYAIWNGTAYSSLVSFPSGSIPVNYLCVSAVLGWDNSYYTLAYGSNLFLKTSYTVSNQYSLTNFYSTQNLNDNAWRHYVWTIDTPNSAYKYYINGNLIKTDISSGYAYPAATTRTNALLATSTDLSLSYFTGGIDSYRVYSGALTDAQVATLFKAEAYSGQNQIQNYTFDTPAFSGINLGNYVSGSYIYDASLNANQSVNLVQNGDMTDPYITSGISSLTAPGTWGRVGNSDIGSFTYGTVSRGGIPLTVKQYYEMYTGAANSLYQTITFPKAGNYVFSFWMMTGQSLLITIGSIVSQTFYETTSGVWKQYTVSFYISSSQLSQVLTFSNTVVNGVHILYTGVSIFNTDNYSLTTSFKNNTGSLSLDVSGQTVNMNAPFTTTSSGLSLTFWARANNGCGQYTLLDYSNGPGGNHKITYGYQNNTPYAQVVNGTSVGTVSVATSVSTLSGISVRNDAENFCVSADLKRIIVLGSSLSFTAYNYNGTSWVSSAVGSITGSGLCCTADGSRLVVSSGTSQIVYTWDGAQYSGATTTGFGLTSMGLAMTPDGRILVVAKGHASTASYIYYSFWNSSANNYTTFIQIPCIAKRWKEVDITPDGTRISYTSYQDAVSYYSIWNNETKTFVNETQFTTSDSTLNGVMRFSKDGNIAFSMGRDNRTLQYAIWNGTSYSKMTVAATSATLGDYTGLFVGWDNVLYFSFWGNTTIPKLPFYVSNQYSISNFYSTQNLNDNAWRHYAWTIDPTNTTYKYYINGSLIKTDVSSGYVFPAPTTRTTNLLGTGTDLPQSYFVGGIANYQTYNGVYTDAQVLALYKADAYSTQTPVAYYTGEPSTVSNNLMTNSISNTFDAVLVGGAAITATNYRTGITSTGSGQYVQINSSLTTTATSSGLTFSLWLRSQNGSGINPLLDYSKGQGNNKVSLALWNGSPYAQVISDVSLGTITLTVDAGFSKTCTGNIFGITLSANHQRMAIITTTGVYYATYSAGTWSAFTALVTATITGGGIAMSSDGSRLVWNQKTAYTYFSVWNSTTSAYGTATQTLDTNYRTFTNLHMTADGTRIVACGGYEPAVLYANWNGTNYSAFTATPAITNTISLAGSTNTSGTWGTPTAGNVFTAASTKPETYYVWENYYSSNNAYWSDSTRPIIFEYNYNNTTGSSISATLYYIIDDKMYFYLNGVVQNSGAELVGGWPNGLTLSLTLPTGNNRFQFACRNDVAQGSAALAVIVKSNTGTLLFNTNATNSGWTLTNPYCGLATTPDGNRIFYGTQVLTGNQTTTNSLYYADWNSTQNNYNSGTLIGVVNSNNSNYLRNIRCSPDGNAVFVSSTGTSFVAWYVFNGTTFVSQNTLSLSTNDVYALDTVWDGPNKYLYVGYATSLTRYTYTASNTYTQTNFYTTQNLNDNVWRHFAWTIDPSTATYKYYLNGVLIKTDTSANYVFPAQTTRTNNLLLTSTDLSMSYFVGSIDNYRSYTGVLTDTQINTLFQTEAYGGQTPQLFQNYTFNQGTNTGVNLVNASTNLYDASLNGGAYISTTNYKTGTGALSLDISGQYVQMNTALTTASNTGLTFSLLARCNNGCGQYTLLDYSNGSGGNNRISLGLQNNTLLGQVVNGTGLGSLTFTTAQTASISTTTFTGIAYSTSANRMVLADYGTGTIYFRTGFTGSNTAISGTYVNVVGVCMTSDGSRLVWSVRAGNCYYATWNETTYSNIQTINSGTAGIQGVDMTDDGQIIVVSIGVVGYGSSGVPLWAYWTGSGYSTYKTILNAITGNYICCAITPDGSRIAYASYTTAYYAVWNGTNYSTTATEIANVGSTIFAMKFSKDGNILFLTTSSGNTLRYFIWNGTSFGSIQSNAVLNAMSASPYGLCLDYDNTIYGCPYGQTSIYKTTFQAENQYAATNFYSAQNLNDNAWRHYAWTIDPSNTTYKYYINGSLIKTDVSSGYAFPALTTRTTNLLGVATDLSLSYFTGGIDQYRVQTGVLTDAQINSLFQADAYNNRSLIQYYNFDPSFNTGTSLANLVSNSTTGVYDASLNGGAYISTTNYKIGGGALAIDASGQSIRFNSQIATSNAGMSFSFWLRGNSGCGQYTLLDYSNGSGGNNRISLGLQNNTLLGQVVNGTGIGSITFTTAQTASISTTTFTGIAYSTSANRMVLADYGTGTIYFRTGFTGSNTAISGTYVNVVGVCMTSDGSRLVWSVRAGNCYYATWNETTYSNIQTINSGTAGIQGVDMTDDGQIIVVAIGNVAGGSSGIPVWAYWTGSGYSTYKTILNTPTDNYNCCAITPDGSRIAYVNDATKRVYYAVWNGTNYSTTATEIANVVSFIYALKFSKDGNILFLTTNSGNTLRYFIWNGTSFGSIQSNAVLNAMSPHPYGLCLDYDNTIYGCPYGQTSIYKTTFQAENQYAATNFYSAQNLNDNAWRHIAWTIDPSNTTYKYYLNGSLIKTDVSSGYAFPAPTTRTNNLLGTSTDLSLSYFIGGIDKYRMFSGVLTDAQIAVLAAESVPEGTITTLYSLDTTTVNGPNIANNASGSYVYDASLNSGETISTTNYKVNVGSLSLDTSGQSLKINKPLTNTTGLSFLFWSKSANGTGQTTLLDYAGGPGGNQKITYGLQNNQIYAQVTNGTTVGTLAFSPAQTNTCVQNAIAVAYSPTTNRVVYATSTGVLYVRTGGLTGTDTATIPGTYPGTNNLCMTSDGSRIVWSIRAGDAYYARWNGTTYTDPQAINSGTATIQGMDMTDDGGILAIVVGNVYGGTSGTPQWAYWAGTGYSAYKAVSNAGVGDFVSCAITPDGSRITYLDYTTNQLYYAIWNGTNYAPETYALYNTGSINSYAGVVSNTYYAFLTGTIECWIKTTGLPSQSRWGILGKVGAYGMYMWSVGGGNCVISSYDWLSGGSGLQLGTTKINDGLWHHVALVFNAGVASGSQLYVDGKPDRVRFTFGGQATTNFFTLCDGSFPFMGNLDEVRIWNIALTDADILRNYNTRISSTTAGLVGYWLLNEGSGTTLNNLVSSGYPLYMGGEMSWVPRDVMPIPAGCKNMKMSKDGNILFLSYPGTTNTLRYLVWDGTFYGGVFTPTTLNTTTVLDGISQGWGLFVDYNNTIYTLDYGTISTSTTTQTPVSSSTSTLYKTTFQASNQYTATHFYAQENMNNSVWRQCAWTIDPYTSTYKYYVNGTLVKTDTSSNYVFPAIASRTSNQIGVSTDLSMSYFKGKLDNYRVYNGLLTDAQITAAYQNEVYSFQPLSQYYTLDNNTTELVQNGYFSLPNMAGSYNSTGAPTGWNYYRSVLYNDGYQFTSGFNGVDVNTPVPTGAFQYILLRDNGSYISQDVVFPCAGNYLLTYYASARVGSSYLTIQTRVNIGTIVVDNITPLISNNWVKYSVSFYVSAASTQTVQFRNYYPTYNAASLMLVGISIVSSSNNLRVANYASGVCSYDASLNTGTVISTNQYKTGAGCLSLDVKGQFTQLSPLTTTANTGVSFSFWAKANNKCGQSTLLDYSNGLGGNQRISLGIQNNNLLAQVVNGSSLSTPSFSAHSLVDTLSGTPKSIAIYSPANRIVYADYGSNQIFVKNGTSSAYAPLAYTSSGIINYIDITSDGNRIVWCVATDYCYYATWDGTTYSNITTINQSSGPMKIYCVEITDDGNTMAVFTADSATGMLWAKWNGNGYLTYAKTTNIIKSNGVITPDGSKVAYLLNGNRLYYDTWDGGNYSNPVYIGSLYSSGHTNCTLAFSKDGNIIFSTSSNLTTSILQYTLWNGTGYGSIMTTGVFSSPMGFIDLKVDYNNTIYALDFDAGYVFKTTYQIPNQYVATNFYTTQNLNDNQWRHYAWTIDPSNTTYRYYLNGSLIYTDSSAGYAFPPQATRINALLANSTDLSLSYFTGAIDNYRVYNGVLTPTQITAMYNYENSSTNTLLSYYPLDALSYAETNVGNYTTGTYVYDATIMGGATITSKSKPPVGINALNLDVSGQYVRLNPSFTTTSSGLSFSLWFKGNNGCGYNTLLDYSNGAGGNQRISLGLQNNTLLGQVVNGTGIGTPIFTTYQSYTGYTNVSGFAYSSSTDRVVYTDGNSVYFKQGFSGSVSTITTYSGVIVSCICITSDGNRIVWSVRGNTASCYCYYATWNGKTFSNIQTINSSYGNTSFNGMDMTDDGSKILVSVGNIANGAANGVPVWANWTGSGYSSYTAILNTTSYAYLCCAITTDGSRIAFGDFPDNNMYYGIWNATQANYTKVGLIGVVSATYALMVRFSKDGNILFIGCISTNTLQYCIWNGNSYGSIITTSVFPSNINSYGLFVDYTNNIYTGASSGGIIYKTTFSVSNQYSATNFYPSQNLNDGAWRHVAWTIDPSNNRYKYYLNGSLIKTDISSGYAFPALTTRTNNLLGVSTDLSMSYFTGNINQYRVQTGVLTDAQVYALYTADAYNSQSMIQYYNFETASCSGTSLGNYASNTYYVMDASLNGGAYISTDNNVVGKGSLSLDTSGQYVRMNNNLPTSIGLSFSFWARGNNGCGYNTLLDYSNGSGGNNRISLGYQNNTLLGQVTNGPSIGTVNINASTLMSSSYTGMIGLAYTGSIVNRLVYTDYTNSLVRFRTGLTGADTTVGTTYTNPIDVRITSDGSRIVWTCRGGYCYYATWNGQTYSNVQIVNPTSGTLGFQGMDMTDDGRIIVLSVGAIAAGSNGVPIWAYWTGSGYSPFINTLNATVSAYICCAITADGSKIAYANYSTNVIYYAMWNGTNYTDGINIGTFTGCRMVRFSRDGNILFVMGYNGSYSLQYYVWNGTTYVFIASNSSVFGINFDVYGLAMDYDNNIYANKNGTGLYKTSFSVSNQYSLTNFYTAQNLNDNAWRHIAWTIDPTNTTYKYYLNGSLIKTDTSSGYIFPGLTSRTNNLLGVSTDLSLSYFTGGIDNYRVYNGVLTDTQVYSLFTADAYNSQSLIQYYPCQTYSTNTLLPTLTTSATLAKYYTFETTNMVSNGVFDSTILSVATAYSYIVPFFWTVLGSNLLVNFLYLNGGSYQYPRGIVPTTINQWCDILTSTTQQNYIAQNIVFPKTGNYTLTCYVQGNSNSLYSTTISLGGNTLITVSATNVPTISAWTKLSATFYISTAPSTQQLKIMVPISASTIEFGITGISITPNTEYSINTVKDTALANMASGTPVYDTTLVGRPIDTTGNSKVGYNGLYVYGTGTTQTQYAQINSVAVTTAGLTISCWFKFTSGTWSRVFQFGTTTDQADSFGFSAYNGSFVYIGTSVDIPQTGLNKNDNQWHHLVWTLTYAAYGSYLSIHNVYLDGANVYSSVAGNYPKVETKTACYIGKGLYSGEDAAVGWVDDFRIYNGVINATDALTLYNNTSISYTYGFGNYTTGSYQYDASFNGGATITTTDYKTGNSALTMDTPTFTIGAPTVGQFVRLNNNLVTSSAGLSFSLWFKARNGLGQYTLLDYSNGQGGNQRISLGLQNNTLLGQVVNGTGIGNPTFTNSTTVLTVGTTSGTGLCMTADGNRLIYCDFNTGIIYTYIYSGSTWSSPITLTVGSNPVGVCCTADGSRLVISRRAGVVQYATWGGTNYLGLTNTGLAGNPDGAVDMTADGRILVVARGATTTAQTTVYSVWNSLTNNYTTFSNVSATSQRWYGIAITPDGSRVAYTSIASNTAYYSVWNNTTQAYENETALTNLNVDVRRCAFSKDGNILFLANGATASFQYAIWNGTTYSSLISFPSGVIPTSLDVYGLIIGWDNTVYILSNGSASILKTTFSVSNQYTATNFYTLQNLNDNTWRHLAWTIDPSNTTYKYYLNGSLIKTDVSSGYAFPALTTRTNNLLGTSTDLSMSYFSGTIDNYCVYNGVLTDTQVYTLFNTDAYNSQQLIQYYSFDTTSAYGTAILSPGVYGYANVANSVSGSNVYDASLNGGARLNTTNYCVGNASLDLTSTGQQLIMKNDLTTSGIGLSFAFWFRANNLCGQYTLLDYSNGSGGNNRISLGLQNNTLFGEVINGTSIGSVTFTTPTSATASYVTGVAYSSSANRLVWTNFNTGYLYYRTGLSGADTSINGAYTLNTLIDVCITNDGNRIVYVSRTGLAYFATWNGSTNYTGFQSVNAEATGRNFQSIDITEDGSILIATIGAIFGSGAAGVPLWAKWNGTNYSAYSTTLNATSDNYIGAAITPDGSRIAYTTAGKLVYYAVWNGTNYSNRILIGSVLYDVGLKLKFSKDGNILFVSSYLYSNAYGALQYCVWNGPTLGFGPLINSGLFSSTAVGMFGMALDYNNNLYIGNYNQTTIYKTTFTVSNQYLQSNFYSAQNLNDNTWRHLAWTIDPSNTTYKYYLNGTPIKTDVSSGYVFPGLTTRKNNLLGTSTDLSMSYFIGGIDNYRVYNGVLTDAQVLSLYKAEAYSNTLTTTTGGTLVQYYTCNSNKWTVQPALTANYSLVHQYTFDYHTVNECMVLNTANYTPVYDCRLTNSSTAPTFDTADYKTGISSLYFSANTLFLQINGIQIPSGPGFSIACWFKYTSGQLFDFGNSGMDNLSYSPSTGITFKNGLTSYTINGGTGRADGTWHHFAWTISQQGSHNVYIDGALSATTTGVYPVAGTRINNYVGKGVGRVDDFRIYSGVLSLTDIQNLYNLAVPTSSTATLLNNYTMDYSQIQNGFVPNTASGSVVYDAVLCNGTASIPTVDISNNQLGTGCLYIAGTNQYAQIKQVNVTNAGMTIAVWVKFTVNPSGAIWNRIIDFGNGTTGNYYNYALWMSGTNMGGYVNNGTVSNGPSVGSTPHLDGKWHHYVWTMTYSATNGSTHVIYMDGVSISTGSAFYYPTPGIRTNNRIGCSTINSDYLNGLVDDLRIYNGVMPAYNVSALYSSTQNDKIVKIPNLTNHYTFEPALVGGNYVANMSSSTLAYDMVLGPGLLPTTDATAGNFKQGLRGLRLDGANKQYVILTNFSVPSSVGMTIACWFKYTSANWSRLFDFGTSTTEEICYSPNNGINFVVGSAIQNNGAASGKADGTWHHFAWSMVYIASGNTTHKVYIDGTPTTYTTWKYPAVGTRTYNYIGKSMDPSNDYATGWVDDFRVYNGVLTDVDVTGIVGSPTYSTSIAPVIYYTFE